MFLQWKLVADDDFCLAYPHATTEWVHLIDLDSGEFCF